MEHRAIETETAELSSPQARLEQLRRTVDEGVHRSLSWRQAQLDGLLQFVSDHEEAMLAALKTRTWFPSSLPSAFRPGFLRFPVRLRPGLQGSM